MTAAETETTFKLRQRVRVEHNGVNAEFATIIRPQKNDPLYPQWQAVRFDDGAKLMVHSSGLSAA